MTEPYQYIMIKSSTFGKPEDHVYLTSNLEETTILSEVGYFTKEEMLSISNKFPNQFIYLETIKV